MIQQFSILIVFDILFRGANLTQTISITGTREIAMTDKFIKILKKLNDDKNALVTKAEFKKMHPLPARDFLDDIPF